MALNPSIRARLSHFISVHLISSHLVRLSLTESAKYHYHFGNSLLQRSMMISVRPKGVPYLT